MDPITISLLSIISLILAYNTFRIHYKSSCTTEIDLKK